MEYLASGFKNVDATDDFSRYANCLSLLNSIEFFKKYKQDSHRMLKLVPGIKVLDIGCGLGDDLLDIAKEIGPSGIVTGLDSSEALLEIARSNIEDGPKNIELVNGNASNLEFDKDTFDRCRVDRVLQHIEDPKVALAEMHRVLKPGGIMLAFDNDWETYTFSSTDDKLVRKVANYWCDSFPSGWIGRYLYSYFSELGLDNIKVYPRTLVINELDESNMVFDMFQTLERMLDEQLISQNEANQLIEQMRAQDRLNSFFSSYTGFIVLGQKAS